MAENDHDLHRVPSGITLERFRSHLSTVVAALVAAVLVAVGVGTRQDARSAPGVGDVPTVLSVGAGGSPASGVGTTAPTWSAFEWARFRAMLGPSVSALSTPGGMDGSSHSARGLPRGTLTATLLGLDGSRAIPVSTPLMSPTLRLADISLVGEIAASRRATGVGADGDAFFNGRPIRPVRTIRMRVTAYSPDERSCGASADGITASGYSVFTNAGHLVAADPTVLPLGSLVSVSGYAGGAAVPVLDTGGAIKGHRLDVLYPTHELAVRWGVQDVDVIVWDYADGLPNGFKRLRSRRK